jgi:phosphate-selective porin OprO/OprP
MPRQSSSSVALAFGLLLSLTPAFAAAQLPGAPSPASPPAPTSPPSLTPAPAPTTPEAIGPAAAPAPAPAAAPQPTPAATLPPTPPAVASTAPAAVAPTAAPAPVQAAPADKKPKKDGFRIQSTDGRSELRVGGYVHVDGRFFLDDSKDIASHDLALRRAHLILEGTLFERFDMRFMPDIAGGKLSVQDVYLDAKVAPYFAVRVGKMKSPFGLERLAPVTGLGLAEFAFPTALAPNRDVGVDVHGELGKGTLTYDVGVFDGATDGGSLDNDFDDDKELVARLFVRPFAATQVDALRGLGLGMAVSWGDVHGDAANTGLPTIKSSGLLTIASFVTGATAEENALAWGNRTRLGPQGNFYYGPVGLQGEYTRTKTNVRLAGAEKELTLSAFQAAARVVVTGEDASDKGVTPKKGVTSGGYGALELAARFHGLTVGSEAETAGFVKPEKSVHKASGLTFGVNYYFEKGILLAVDYDRTKFTGGQKDDGNRETENLLLTRLQFAY